MQAETTEKSLIARLRKGEGGAMADLQRLYGAKIYQLALPAHA